MLSQRNLLFNDSNSCRSEKASLANHLKLGDHVVAGNVEDRPIVVPRAVGQHVLHQRTIFFHHHVEGKVNFPRGALPR